MNSILTRYLNHDEFINNKKIPISNDYVEQGPITVKPYEMELYIHKKTPSLRARSIAHSSSLP